MDGSRFRIGFEKQAKKIGIADYLRHPLQSEKALKKTLKYQGGRAALALGVPTAGAAYLLHKATGKNEGGPKSQRMSATPNYY